MTETLLARRERVLGTRMPLFYNAPVHITRGDGVYLESPDGTRYLDMYNNVPCVGHANPQVVAAMQGQAATLNVHSRYLHEGIIDYAERLLARHAAHLTKAVFACTGTEANEVAMAMARIATGGEGFICSDAAYHGNSREVSRLTRAGAKQDPTIRAVPFPQTFRPIAEGLSDAELCDRYVAEVARAIEDFAANDVPLAGMLVCPLFANEGLPNVPAGYLQRAGELVRDAGGVLIIDEVQSGFCRTGQWWGYEVMGASPDIVSMGKPMGNGLPLSGVVARGDIVDQFREKSGYFNTFASSPLQAAVGNAVLDVIEQQQLTESITAVGNHLRSELAKIQHPAMADVRGYGLFTAIEWVTNRDDNQPDRAGAVKIVNALKDRGFLISNAGVHGNVLKIRPPLVFQHEHADAFLNAFADTLRQDG